MPSQVAPVSCEQFFSRKGLGYLWDNRESLDTSTVDIIKTLWRSKKPGSLLCKQQIEYRHATSRFGKMGYGRLYCRGGVGLERLEKEARGTLCKDYYHDIDIVNCHPVLLVQYAKRNYNRDMPHWTYYIQHREEVLNALSESRQEAKEMIIKVMYGGKTDHPELVEMASELNKLTKFMAAQQEHQELFDECKKEDNRYATFLSYVLQTEEVKCMLAMKGSFESQGWSVDVLAYDGVMIRIRQDVKLDENILSEAEEAILTATGYKVSVIEKPMMSFEIPEGGEKEDALTAAYAAMKAKWETNHFYFRPNNTIVEQRADGRTISFSLDHAGTAFNMWVLPDDPSKPKMIDQPNYFLTRWNKDAERRIIDDYVFKPTEACAKNEVSLFKGFHYQSLTPCENPKAIEMFCDILKSNCNDDETTYAYMLKWFARMIQNPFEKSATCPIFINKSQGTGKDTICLWMKKLMKNHVGHYTNDEDLFEKHDGRKEGAVLMYLEEVGSGVCKSKATALKAMITSDSVSINPKGERCYSVPNVGNYIMTTNDENPVRIENSDRRFFPIETSRRLLGKHEFWREFHSIVKFDIGDGNPEWLYPVGKFLEGIDLTGFNPRNLPVSECKNEILAVSKPSLQQFLEVWKGDQMIVTDFLTAYEAYCMENRLRMVCKPDTTSFGHALRSYKTLFLRRESNGKIMYSSLNM